jgi:hypothetical protein
MMAKRWWLVVLLSIVPVGLVGQQPDFQSQMTARGLPPALVAEVTAIAADATAAGLPAGPLVDKAIEGWAKRVPQQRILGALNQFRVRLQEAQQALVRTGHGEPAGPVVAAAAEAMAQGIREAQIGGIVDAAQTPASAGHGLRVAAALAAQGIDGDEASAIVVQSMHRGWSDAQLLDLPSFANQMRAQGTPPAQVGQRLMQGGGSMVGAGQSPGMGSRPPGVPPGNPDQAGSGQSRTRRP